MGLIELPRPLAPWAAHLALFPREVALALAPLVQRLHALLGEGRGAAGTGGEPDGYDGIARRGPYERLLGTEWLLLSEMPEEFLRRVTAGEHAFLKLAHRPPSGGRRAALLFDAGPDQLGGPRIAHLAVLVVLAARLARQRGTLSWGALQDETCSLETEVSPASVRALFAARSARAVAREDVARWLGDTGVAGASEVWLVGGEDLRAEQERRSTSMLVVADALSPGARRLLVRALPAGASRAAEAALDLPEVPVCIRITKDPFGAAVSPRTGAPAAPDPSSGLVFSSNGRRLFLRAMGGQLLVLVVPNSPRAPVPPPAVFEPPEGQVVVAAGTERLKGRAVVVCAGRDAYFSHRLSASRTMKIGSREHRPDGDLGMPAGPPGPLVPLRVSDAGAIRFQVSPARQIVLEGDTASLATPIDPDAQRGDPLWRVEDGREVTGPGGLLVVGHLGTEQPGRERRMVLLEPDRRRIDGYHGGERKRLVSTPSPIHAVQVARDLGLVGFVTEAGEVGVYSIQVEALVLRVHPAGVSP